MRIEDERKALVELRLRSSGRYWLFVNYPLSPVKVVYMTLSSCVLQVGRFFVTTIIPSLRTLLLQYYRTKYSIPGTVYTEERLGVTTT